MIDRGKRSVAGVLVDAVDYEEALARIHAAAEARCAYAVTAVAVHGVMSGAMNEQQKYRLNHFDLVVPDGQPVRWALNLLHGLPPNDRVDGPELSFRTLAMAEQEAQPVYFYGSTNAVLTTLRAQLLKQFPDLRIVGMEASRGRQLDARECAELVDRILQSGAMVTFVGLGCPRQEIFAYEMAPLLTMPVIAVGAAFGRLTTFLSQVPSVFQRLRLQRLYDCLQMPGRLFRDHLYWNPYYLWMIGGQVLGLNYSRDGKKPMQLERHG